MSRAGVLIYRGDEQVGWSLYDGTSDVQSPIIVKTQDDSCYEYSIVNVRINVGDYYVLIEVT